MLGFDWHWFLLLPFVVALVVRYVPRAWRLFGMLLVVIACLLTLVVVRHMEISAQPDEVLGMAFAASFWGFLAPTIGRLMWRYVSRPNVRWWFIAGALIVLSAYSVALQQVLMLIAVMTIMLFGVWIMIGRPRLR